MHLVFLVTASLMHLVLLLTASHKNVVFLLVFLQVAFLLVFLQVVFLLVFLQMVFVPVFPQVTARNRVSRYSYLKAMRQHRYADPLQGNILMVNVEMTCHIWYTPLLTALQHWSKCLLFR